MQKVNKVLAIVGGGSVATSFLCQFAESIDKSSRYALKLGISEVLIFEPKHTEKWLRLSEQPSPIFKWKARTNWIKCKTSLSGKSGVHRFRF